MAEGIRDALLITLFSIDFQRIPVEFSSGFEVTCLEVYIAQIR